MSRNGTGLEEHTIVAGIRPVVDLLRHAPETADSILIREGRRGREVDEVISLCRSAGVRFSLVDNAALDRLFNGNHQGVAARVFSAGYAAYEELLAQLGAAPLPLLVVLDQVQDPGNVGALARTLYGLGAAGLVVAKHGGAALGAAAVRASAGTLARLPVARVTNIAQALDKALDQGVPVYAAGGQPGEPKTRDAFNTEANLPGVLVLGNEEHGVRPNVLKRCSICLRIPLRRDLNSLNVAQAGGILAALLASRRGL